MLKYIMAVSVWIFLSGLLMAQDPASLDQFENEDELVRLFLEDVNGKLTPEIMTVLKDSGAYKINVKVGPWSEYLYKPCFLCDAEHLHYDSLLKASNLILVKETGSYVKGERNGLWTSYETWRVSAPFEWHKASQVTYTKGLKQGWEYHYMEHSERQYVSRMTQMKDGTRHGLEYRFDEKGDTLVAGQYQLGLQHGRFKFRHDTIPALNFDRIYASGEQVETIYFHPNGQVSMRGREYDFGFDGLVKYYSKSGELAFEITYDQGEATGASRRYENGKLVMVQNFKKGIADGRMQYYHSNGRLWTEVEMKNGKTWTVISNYDKNGNKKEMGTLREGNGTLIRYDANGNRIAVERFKNGLEIK